MIMTASCSAAACAHVGHADSVCQQIMQARAGCMQPTEPVCGVCVLQDLLLPSGTMTALAPPLQQQLAPQQQALHTVTQQQQPQPTGECLIVVSHSHTTTTTAKGRRGSHGMYITGFLLFAHCASVPAGGKRQQAEPYCLLSASAVLLMVLPVGVNVPNAHERQTLLPVLRCCSTALRLMSRISTLTAPSICCS